MTIDLFGADESSNAATFYSTGLKGRYEEGKRDDDHRLRGQTYKVLDVADGKLVEKEVPMLNALNEVLRDDYIKDSVAGVDRWNKVIEKAGIPFRLRSRTRPSIATSARWPASRSRPRARSSTRPSGRPTSASGCPRPRIAPSSPA